MKILICGYGNIGHHIENEFKALADNITIYDKYKTDFNDINILKSHYDVAFVSVPTEKLSDGSCDTSEVEWIAKRINAEIIIIKSAIPVGTCEKIGLDNVIISPEYYGTTVHSLDSPNFLVVGLRDKKLESKVQAVYGKVKSGDFRYIFTDWRTAELVKYMENCWIATKVTFCNEFATIAKQFNINYPELRECWVADERVSPSHTYVFEDKPYFDSHCLNKDIPALIEQCKGIVDTPLMNEVYNIKLTREKEFKK